MPPHPPVKTVQPAPVSRRRTCAVSGYVAFPVEHPDYASSREGGLVVKLVVVDDREYDVSDWTICCGAQVTDLYTESLVGDDKAPVPATMEFSTTWSPEQCLAEMDREQQAHRAWEARHYPFLHDESAADYLKYLSRPYVASLVLGVTGWSGCHPEHGYWHCTVNDLTDEGRALYRQLEALYPSCTLHLLTFLDT